MKAHLLSLLELLLPLLNRRPMLLAFFFQAQNVDNTSTAELLNPHFAVDVLVDILVVEPRQKKNAGERQPSATGSMYIAAQYGMRLVMTQDDHPLPRLVLLTQGLKAE